MTQDEKWMKKAWMQAKVAAKKGEVPVGAVVVKDGRIIARAHNLRESAKDPTAHAEILAMRRAAKKLGGGFPAVFYMLRWSHAPCVRARRSMQELSVWYLAPMMKKRDAAARYWIFPGKKNLTMPSR